MKKLIYIGILLTTLLSSCVQDVDDLFDKSASERSQESVDQLQALLQSPEHGWVMEYYPEVKQSYGGYIYTLKFGQNDQVTVSGELKNNASASKTSLYSIKTDMGPTLNLDTYNEIFHYLADPDPHSYSHYGFWESGLTAGKGFEGDYEFVLQSSSKDEIVFKGKKTKNIIRMTPLAEAPKSHLEKLLVMKTKIDNLPDGSIGFKGELGGKELFFEMDQQRHFSIKYDGVKVGAAASCPTMEGLKFYEPIVVAGKKMQYFSFANSSLTCMDQGATDVSVKVYKDPAFVSYREFIGAYTFAYDNIKRNVTIEEKVKGESLTIKGFSPNFDVVLRYDATAGKAYLTSQKVATVNGRDIWISAWDTQTGNLTWDVNMGMVTEWNQSTNNFVLTFKDYGSWAEHVISGLYYYSFDAGGKANGAFFNGWGSNSFCSTLKTLTKK